MIATALLAAMVCSAAEREVVLFPAQIQLNGKLTQHYGVGAELVWHLQRSFGFRLSGFFNYSSDESGFHAELNEKTRAESQWSSGSLSVWGLLGGFEVLPVEGDLDFYGRSFRLAMVIGGGAGLGGTRQKLAPANQLGPAVFADTGLRFLGNFGGGLVVVVADRFALRLEVRDLVFSSVVSSVNGCSRADLKELDYRLRAGSSDPSRTASGGCSFASFESTNHLPLAYNAVKAPGGDLVHNVMLSAGASFLF